MITILTLTVLAISFYTYTEVVKFRAWRRALETSQLWDELWRFRNMSGHVLLDWDSVVWKDPSWTPTDRRNGRPA